MAGQDISECTFVYCINTSFHWLFILFTQDLTTAFKQYAADANGNLNEQT